MECYEKFKFECARHESCGDCALHDWKEGTPVPASVQTEPPERPAYPEKPEAQKHTALAIFDIDVDRLWKKDEQTFYSPATRSWKDGIVFKFNKGIPDRGSPCIAIFKWDRRNKYHDFVAGKPRTVGRGMPVSMYKYEQGKLYYGIRPVVHIYPATQDPNRPAIRYRLVLVNWDLRSTSRGGRSSGELVDTSDGRVVYQITGSEQSREGNHGAIWVCAVVEGSPKIHRVFVSNDTCNVRELTTVV